MKQILLPRLPSAVLGACLMLVLAACPLAAAPAQIYADDFNDNTKDVTKWGADFNFEGSGGVFTETSQRLEFTLASALQITRVRPWIQALPTYGQDWEILVDAVNNRTFTTLTDGNGLGIAIQDTATGVVSDPTPGDGKATVTFTDNVSRQGTPARFSRFKFVVSD